MISDHATSAKVEKLMRDAAAKIDESVGAVLDGGNETEFRKYRLIAGKLMGDILLEILNPIYAKHPDLTPLELRQDGRAYDA